MDINEVRKANLRKLAKEMGSSELARKLGYRHPSYISQMIGAGANRPLTEKNARKYEKDLKLSAGWFDQRHQDTPAAVPAPAPVAAETSTELVADVIRVVGTVLQNENLQVPPARFADLVALAYVDSAEHGGKPREAHIKSLVKLLK